MARLTSTLRQSARGVFEHRWFRVAVSISLMAILLSFVDIGQALQLIREADPAFILLGFAMFVPDRLFATYRWFILVRKDNPHLRYLATLRITLVASFLGFFMPGQIGVEVVRIYGLQAARIDMASSVSSVLIERGFAVFGLLVLMILGIVLAPSEMTGVALTVGFSVMAILFFAAISFVNISARRATQAIIPGKLYARVGPSLEKFYQAVDRYRDRKGLLAFSLLVGVLFQVYRLTHLYVFAIALNIDISYFAVLTLMPIARLIEMIPITIAGIGLRESAFVLLLGTAGVPAANALMLSVLMFSANIVANLPGALFLRDLKRGR